MKRIIFLFAVLACIHVKAQVISYNINKRINCPDTLLVFEPQTYSYGLNIDGSGELLSDTAYIRIILVDNQDRHWLMYERNDLYATEDNFAFQGAAFETSLLDSIVPRVIIAQIDNSILNVVCIKNTQTRPNKVNLNYSSDSIYLSKSLQLVARINDKLAQHKKAWRADTTSLARKSVNTPWMEAFLSVTWEASRTESTPTS